MLLTVESIVEGTKQVFKIIGILDFATIDTFKLNQKIADSVTDIEIDFTELEFIDSTGIGAIISILHNAASLNIKVQFTGMSDEIIYLFETIGVFDVKNSLLGGDDNHATKP
nr:STAS domain-containing protein [Lysinibacillus timonensis]